MPFDSHRTRVRQLGIAVLATMAATLLRVALGPLIGPGSPFMLYVPSIAISASVGGIWPGILATMLSMLSSWYFFLPPHFSFARPSSADLGRMAGFIITGLAITLMAAWFRRTVTAYATSERHAKQVADSAPVFLARCDRDGRYLFVNKPYADRLGLRREEILGKTIAQISGEQAYQAVRRHVEAALAGNQVEFEAEINYKNGGPRWMRICFAPDRDAFGRVQGLVAAMTDQTEFKRAENELRDRTARYQLVMRSTSDAIWDWNLEADIVEWNEQVGTIFGYEQSEVESTAAWWSDQIHPDDRARVLEHIHKAIEGGDESWTDTYRFRKRDGSYADVFDRGYISRDVSGKATRMIGSMLDITGNARSQRWLEAVVDSLPLPMIFVEPETAIVTFANKAADLLAGGEFPKGKPADHYHELYYCTDENGVRIPNDRMPGVRVARGERLHGFQMNWHLPGMVRPLILYADTIPAMHGHPATCIVIFEDISELKRTEAELRLLNTALQQANADLEQFAYSASHDLQEPLRMVATFSQLLKHKYDGKLDATADEYIGFCVSGAQRMSMLIHDLLAYTRASSASLDNCEVTDMTAVLEETIRNLEGAIRESNAHIAHQELPPLRIERVHAEQLFQNLIGNAIKYRKPGVTPLVRISCEREGSFWTFAVADNGIGIEPRFQDQIFGIFKRLHGQHVYDGTGMGLAICQRLVERYGGRIWVESQPAEGSTFKFSLPAGTA